MHSRGSHVVIALGSNVGDRARCLWQALQALSPRGVQVLRSSNLYETSAAYVTDQPSFLNAAVLVHTQHSPRDLLRHLKDIEQQAGRDLQGGPRWGPRPVDLDIIAYGGRPYQDDVLQVPHPRWRERPFVTAPVADLFYQRDAHAGRITSATAAAAAADVAAEPHPDGGASDEGGLMHLLSVAAALHPIACAGPVQPEASREAAAEGAGAGGAAAPPGISGGDILSRVSPLLRRRNALQRSGAGRTLVMGILNVTPDSFSDGGMYMGTAQAVAHAEALWADGADILDIGGQSTRPGATRLTQQEEMSRVVPVIRAIRASGGAAADAVLSVDTFDADVAREAVLAGADIVNDVSGGTLDPRMHAQVAELGVPYVLMHMRGDPHTMTSTLNTTYECTWRDVGTELQAAAERAMAAGVAGWNLILDPGIGFAKNADGNLQLIRHLSRLRGEVLQGGLRHAPMLAGPSRKGFLGKLTGRVAAERDAATVAACVACVAGGAGVVRVHDVRGVGDGVKVADAIYRQ